jgi:TrmH family RNA methyltransferase
MEKIISLQNSRIKNLVKLHKSAERREQGLFLVEGLKEIKLAIASEYQLQSIYWCPGLGIQEKAIVELTRNSIQSFEITHELFNKIAYRDGSDGLMGVFKTKNLQVNDLKLKENPFLLILESIEKPGNLGAILRTADAAGVDAVIICDERTDIFNPNVIRSSVGCLFTNQVVACSSVEAFDWLKKNKITSYAAALVAESKPYQHFNYKHPTAIVLGTEAEGLTEFWLKNSSQQIIIPMFGKIDSLNVSVSAAVLAFEVVRQRTNV